MEIMNIKQLVILLSLMLFPLNLVFANNQEDYFKKPNGLEVAYDLAIKHKPDFADAYYNKGLILAKLGKHIEANEVLKKSSDLKKSH